MKKILLLLPALCLAALTVMSQDCKYAKNEYDPFLKINKIETKETIVYNWKKRLSLSFANYGGKKFIMANITLPTNPLFAQGDNMIILFEDGSTAEFELLAESGKTISFGQRLNAAGMDYYVYKLTYKLDSVEALAGKKLAGIRIYGASTYTEFPKGKTAMELGGMGKGKKAELLDNIFTEQNLNCISTATASK